MTALISHSLAGEQPAGPNHWIAADGALGCRATVPASLLDIKPSTYVRATGVVTYNDNAASTCYWPNGLCLRNTGTSSFAADISSCPAANTWGITYDDGPTSNIVGGVHTADTAAIRNALAGVNAKATFFVCGTAVQSNPSELLATYDAGHQIGVHTWTHNPLTSLTNAQVVAEIKYTEALIYSITKKVPTHFRPPYGDVDDRVRAIAAALGYRTAICAVPLFANVVIWTTGRDSQDAANSAVTGGAAIVRASLTSWAVAQPGFISLQHDISTFVSQIAVDALAEIKAKGASYPLSLQSVSQCTGTAAYWDGTSAVSVPGGTGAGAVLSSAASAMSSAAGAASSALSSAASGSRSPEVKGKGGDATETSSKPATGTSSSQASTSTATRNANETVVPSGAQGLYSWVTSLVVAAVVALGLPLL
ncbi:chitin deacetylase [Geranomyces michiganensis]|nr:chitin deacetylase [Geranomyces michiganensis]